MESLDLDYEITEQAHLTWDQHNANAIAKGGRLPTLAEARAIAMCREPPTTSG